jgi:hypothetical protein
LQFSGAKIPSINAVKNGSGIAESGGHFLFLSPGKGFGFFLRGKSASHEQLQMQILPNQLLFISAFFL